ncbi:MAG: nitrilase-related carbon-nitrogen hydrolase, partial [Actinomycetota bacterium]
MSRLRVAAAQIDVVVGDLDGNERRILDAYARAAEAGCDLVVFPELTVTGYPPEDLLLRRAFVDAAGAGLARIAAQSGPTVAVVGFPEPTP